MSDILFKLMSVMGVASVPTVGTGTGFSANPETTYGTADYTITTFPSTGAGINGNTDTIVAVDLTLSATNDGVLFDLGGAGGHGMSAGFENGNLRARAFSASGTDWNTNANAAYVEIDLSNCQYTDVDTTYYFVADFSAGTLEVYAQAGGPTSGNEIFLLGSDTAGASYSATYGSNGKGYGQVNSSIADLGTNYEVNFNGTIDEIRIWTEDATLDSSGFPELPASDVTPDALNWNTISTAGSSGSTNTQTISGINTTITLRVTYNRDDEAYTLVTYVNGSSVGGATAPSNYTFTVNNGDTVYFFASGGQTDNSSATVTNVSDSDAVLDTFGIDLQN
jgi:hypothetical protein